MPRTNRRRRDERPLAVGRLAGSVTATEQWQGSLWSVRRVTGASSVRTYLCPGCQHEVAVGTPHVVVWPAEGVGGLGDRRHWHTACWAARHRHHPRGATR